MVVFGVWCIIENGKHTRAPYTHVRMSNVPDLFFRLKIAVDTGGVRSRLARTHTLIRIMDKWTSHARRKVKMSQKASHATCSSST